MISVIKEITKFGSSLARINKNKIKIIHSPTTNEIYKLHRAMSKYVDKTVDKNFGLKKRQKGFARSRLPSYPKSF